MQVIYEDNHLIAVNKAVGEIVQGDKTGDEPLSEAVKRYLKERYQKPGNVFCGVIHRLDRPVTGAVLFAKTSKGLERMNRMLAARQGVTKRYWAIVCGAPEEAEGHIESFLVRVEKQNKSYSYPKERPGAKWASLDYRVAARGDRYTLLEVDLHTGRHHQIRCQLASIGCPIKGDLKYGAPRSNPDGGISLHARYISFEHPVSKKAVSITAPVPEDNLWRALTENL